MEQKVNKQLDQITKTRKKISALKKLLIALFTLLTIGFGATMHILTDIESELVKAQTVIQADSYMK